MPRKPAVTNFSKDSKAQMNAQDKRLIWVFILGLTALLLSLLLGYLFRDFTSEDEAGGFAGSAASRSRNEPSQNRGSLRPTAGERFPTQSI